MRSLFTVAALAAASLALTPAHAEEPRPIRSASKLKPGVGAVHLSVQSQTQQRDTLHVWFLLEGGSTSNSHDLLKFERKVGVPLAGSNMVDSRPFMYALKPGRYRLIGHSVKCATLPPEGTAGCRVSGKYENYSAPAGRYGAEAPVFEVTAGQVTDAGEYILEAPRGSPISEGSAIDFAWDNPKAFSMRVRPSTVPIPAEFETIPRGPAMVIPVGFDSQITCSRRPKGAMMFIPFTC